MIKNNPQLTDKQNLIYTYMLQKKSLKQIAKLIGVSYGTICSEVTTIKLKKKFERKLKNDSLRKKKI